MRCIGVLGGMSWESTASYYRLLNEGVKARLGGLHSARLIIYSVDFDEIEQLQRADDWVTAGHELSKASQALERAGADCLLIATNTMHRVADAIEESIDIPLLHIADATGKRLSEAGVTRVGLLGTRFTMEQAFYRQRIERRFGVQVMVPEEQERELIHRVIYQELCLGQICADSKASYLEIIHRLHEAGAEAVILGCTEIALLVQSSDTAVPLYDTTALHADYAVQFAIGRGDLSGT